MKKQGELFKIEIKWPESGTIHNTLALASELYHLDKASLACKFGRLKIWNQILSDKEHEAIMMLPDSTGIVPDRSGNNLNAKIKGDKWYHVRIAHNKVKKRTTYYLDNKRVSKRELQLRGLLSGPIRVTRKDLDIMKKIGTVDICFDLAPGDKIVYSNNQKRKDGKR